MRFSLVHWLIATAVLANLAVFYWQHSQSQPIDRPASVKGLRELKLLSEIDQQSSLERGSGSVPVASPASSVSAEQPVAAPSNTREAAGDRQEQSGTPMEADNEKPALAAAATAPPEAEEALPEPAPRCWLAGPVDNDALSEQLTAAFAAAGVSMDLVLQTTEVTPDNWVHLPTSGEQADVRRLSRELRQAGFDNFPINDGPLAGSLSLGLFRSQERALAVRDTLRQRGYPADIFERQAFAEQPWISLDERGRIALDWPAVEGEVAGYEALRLLPVECLPQS